MATLVIPPWSNILRRSLLASSSEDAAFPRAGLTDQVGGNPFRLNADGTGSITIDTEPSDSGGLRDGGYEAATMAAGGHVDTSTAGNAATLDAVAGEVGSQALKLNLAAPGAAAYAQETRTFTRIPTGSRGTIAAMLQGSGTVPVGVRVYVPQLDRYLDSLGVFGAAGVVQDVWSQTAAAWATHTALPLTLPTYAETGLPYVSLQLIARAHDDAAAGVCWVDEFRLCLSPDTMAVHGHNIMPRIVPTWQGSATGAWAGEQVTLATLVPRERKFYSHLSAASDLRFHRWLYTGTNADAEPGGPQIWHGEAALGQAITLARACRWEGDFARQLAAHEDHERERITLSWIWRTDAEYQDSMREIGTLARFGEAPFWLVPVAIEDRVLFCRAAGAPTTPRLFRGIWEAKMEFVEEPFPSWVPDDV